METSSGVRVEGGAGRADRGEHPAPVGVVAEDRALEQVVAGDRPGDLEGVGLRRGGAHLDRDVVVGALGVGDELAGQARADLRDGVGEVGRRRPRPPRRRRPAGPPCRWSTGSRRSRSGRRSSPWRRAGCRRAGRRSTTASVVTTTSIVASAGASMPAPLAMPADRPAVALGDGDLVDGVGGLDRDGRVALTPVGRSAAAAALDTGEHLVHRAAARRSARSSRRRRRGRRRRGPRRPSPPSRGCRRNPARRCTRWPRRS